MPDILKNEKSGVGITAVPRNISRRATKEKTGFSMKESVLNDTNRNIKPNKHGEHARNVTHSHTRSREPTLLKKTISRVTTRDFISTGKPPPEQQSPPASSPKQDLQKNEIQVPGSSSLRPPTLHRARSELIKETVSKLGELDDDFLQLMQKKEESTFIERTTTYFKTELGSEGSPSPDREPRLKRYEDTCRRLGVNPLLAVKRQLASPHITLCNLGLNPRDTLAICNTLLNSTELTELRLEGNRLGDVGTKYVAALVADCVSLTSLVLCNNLIGSAGLSDIVDMMEYNSLIKVLNLSGNLLQDRDVDLLVRLLESSTTLERLDLSHSNLGDDACAPLGAALGINESIRHLNLSWNKIRPKGAILFFQGLKDNIVLKSLNLSMNGLSNEGAAALAFSLTSNATLTDVDVTHNRIGDEGARHLAKALQTNESLKYLELQNNPITDKGALALLTAISRNENSGLHELNLATVHLGESSVKLHEDICSKKPDLDVIYQGTITASSRDYAMEARGKHRQHNPKQPLGILKDYMEEQGLRLIDFFKQMDKDGGGSISRDEFVNGLQSIKVPLTTAQLDELIKELDTDGDGEVDYGELASGEKEYRLRRRKERALKNEK